MNCPTQCIALLTLTHGNDMMSHVLGNFPSFEFDVFAYGGGSHQLLIEFFEGLTETFAQVSISFL